MIAIHGRSLYRDINIRAPLWIFWFLIVAIGPTIRAGKDNSTGVVLEFQNLMKERLEPDESQVGKSYIAFMCFAKWPTTNCLCNSNS
jgi:hypothetical protein